MLQVMTSSKFRWSRVYESNEEELLQFLDRRGILAKRFALKEFETAAAIQQSSETTLWCAEGSLSVQSESGSNSLQPGDGLRLVSASTDAINAGMTGCVYYLSPR